MVSENSQAELIKIVQKTMKPKAQEKIYLLNILVEEIKDKFLQNKGS